MVTAVLVLLAAALLVAGHLRDDALLVALALALSLLAVVVETVQVLRARRRGEDADSAPTEPGPPAALAEPEPEVEPQLDQERQVDPEPEPEPEPTPAAEEPPPVRLPGRTTYHRHACPTVRGKRIVLAELDDDGPPLTPCRRCHPVELVPAGGEEAEGADAARDR